MDAALGANDAVLVFSCLLFQETTESFRNLVDFFNFSFTWYQTQNNKHIRKMSPYY